VLLVVVEQLLGHLLAQDAHLVLGLGFAVHPLQQADELLLLAAPLALGGDGLLDDGDNAGDVVFPTISIGRSA
jgi:hypothetical protein